MTGVGRFITIEGGEGAGKSTQVRLLAEWLTEHGHEVIATREPGGSPAAEAVRAVLLAQREKGWDPMAEALLHFAARRQHVADTIGPALRRGRWVVSDRFADSTMAYQGHVQGVAGSAVAVLYGLTIAPLRPDLTIMIDVPVDEALGRLAARGGDQSRYDRMPPGFHQQVRDAFLAIAAGEPARCVVVDGRGAADEVQARVRAAVEARILQRLARP